MLKGTNIYSSCLEWGKSWKVLGVPCCSRSPCERLCTSQLSHTPHGKVQEGFTYWVPLHIFSPLANCLPTETSQFIFGRHLRDHLGFPDTCLMLIQTCATPHRIDICLSMQGAAPSNILPLQGSRSHEGFCLSVCFHSGCKSTPGRMLCSTCSPRESWCGQPQAQSGKWKGNFGQST